MIDFGKSSRSFEMYQYVCIRIGDRVNHTPCHNGSDGAINGDSVTKVSNKRYDEIIR